MDQPRLTHVAYDRAAHRRTDEQWLAQAWPNAQVVLVGPAGTTPVVRGDGVVQISLRPSALVPADAPRRFLGVLDEQPYFSVTTDAGEDWGGLRDLGPAVDDLREGLLTSAVALQLWHNRHTHCPRCGAPTREAQAGWTRVCTAEGSEHFPRTDPAVIMVVHDGGDRCLLGRGAAWGPGRFSTLAGFVEPGESLEAAVAREVYEESSVVVGDIRYVASQPWPFPASLMVGFSAQVSGSDAVKVDGVEMVEAGWFTRAEVQAAADRVDGVGREDPDAVLQQISPKLSISRFLIDRWLAGGH